MKTTRELLKTLIQNGKTQKEISHETKIGQSTISRILNGVNKEPFSRVHGKIFEYYQSEMSGIENDKYDNLR